MEKKIKYFIICAVISVAAVVYAKITGGSRAYIFASVSAVYGVLALMSGFWEEYSEERFARLRQKYRYINKWIGGSEESSGAKPLKKHGRTMKSDMTYRYRSHMTLAPVLCGILFICLIFNTPDAGASAFITAGVIAAAMLGYGMYRFLAVPVRRFYRECGENAELISEDYMDGSLFVRGREGINIGRRYIVYFSGGRVCAKRTADIRGCAVTVKNDKQILEEIYLYSVVSYKISLIFKSGYITINLDKKRADAVLSELKVRGVKIFEFSGSWSAAERTGDRQ